MMDYEDDYYRQSNYVIKKAYESIIDRMQREININQELHNDFRNLTNYRLDKIERQNRFYRTWWWSLPLIYGCSYLLFRIFGIYMGWLG